ncbi:hypothetical protein Ljor_2088 [Legionella jordanis]|uniref:Uncharacterized protein n=1 Tax=Legionella jordanis TaxID=456 RepID=A0A0W0VD51_9GAMM|nr:hypothetical protein Ljor_2088 [Legionella jordanis]VEH11282.1 Uncharacterised protein [Legionella jordanis]
MKRPSANSMNNKNKEKTLKKEDLKNISGGSETTKGRLHPPNLPNPPWTRK